MADATINTIIGVIALSSATIGLSTIIYRITFAYRRRQRRLFNLITEHEINKANDLLKRTLDIDVDTLFDMTVKLNLRAAQANEKQRTQILNLLMVINHRMRNHIVENKKLLLG
jgi:23S rRNA G2445 N2-methylase RlmL